MSKTQKIKMNRGPLYKSAKKEQVTNYGKRKANQVLQTIVGPRVNLGGSRSSAGVDNPTGTKPKRISGGDLTLSSNIPKRKGTKRNPGTRIKGQTPMKSRDVGAKAGISAQKARNRKLKKK